jgi:hypothetical protein
MTFIKVQPMVFIRFQYLHIGTHTEFVEAISVTLFTQEVKVRDRDSLLLFLVSFHALRP